MRFNDIFILLNINRIGMLCTRFIVFFMCRMQACSVQGLQQSHQREQIQAVWPHQLQDSISSRLTPLRVTTARKGSFHNKASASLVFLANFRTWFPCDLIVPNACLMFQDRQQRRGSFSWNIWWYILELLDDKMGKMFFPVDGCRGTLLLIPPDTILYVICHRSFVSSGDGRQYRLNI